VGVPGELHHFRGRQHQTTALEAVPGALQLGKGGKIQCNVCPSAEVLLSCITGREADDPLLCQLLGLLARNIASHPECLQAVDAGSGCRPGQKASIAGWWHRG
jgi:hypothetical protein